MEQFFIFEWFNCEPLTHVCTNIQGLNDYVNIMSTPETGIYFYSKRTLMHIEEVRSLIPTMCTMSCPVDFTDPNNFYYKTVISHRAWGTSVL
jgi:hypothetical protein